MRICTFHQGFYLQMFEPHYVRSDFYTFWKLLWFAVFSLACGACAVCFISTVKLTLTSSQWTAASPFCASALFCTSILLSQPSLQICLEGHHCVFKALFSLNSPHRCLFFFLHMEQKLAFVLWTDHLNVERPVILLITYWSESVFFCSHCWAFDGASARTSNLWVG